MLGYSLEVVMLVAVTSRVCCVESKREGVCLVCMHCMCIASNLYLCQKEQDGWAWTPSGPGMDEPGKESGCIDIKQLVS